MDVRHATGRFWTTPVVTDRRAGSTALRLHHERAGAQVVAAEVVFWDADGQFSLETFNGDVPLAVIEALIAEAKDRIRVG